VDASAAGILKGDEGDAEFLREFHRFDDLRRVHLADGAAGDGEILGDRGNELSVHVARAGDDRIRRNILAIGSEMPAAMADMHAGLLKGVGLEKSAKPIARGHEAFLMARLYLVVPAPGHNPSAALTEPLKFGRLHLPSLNSASRADCFADCEMSSIFLSTRQQAPCVDGKSRLRPYRPRPN